MKKLVLAFVLCLAALCGCSRHYILRLNNGAQITTNSKPKLKGSAYHYKDAMGREQIVPQGRVTEIMPASMAKDEKEMFKPTSK